MPGLLDIAPSFNSVTVHGHKIDVTGVSAKGVAYLLSRFPEFRMLLTGKGANIDADKLMDLAPDAIAAIIACGTGHPGDEQAEQVAARLGLEAQFDLVQAIVKETMPGGVGPFAEKFQATFKGLNVSAKFTSTADGKSPKDSNS